MKKFLFSIFVCCMASSADAQVSQTIGFESISLSSESFYNGSDGLGDITIGSAVFENTYDSQFSYWNGFSISNVTDNTTSGYGNQYSSFAGGGLNSANYAVYYPSGKITFPYGAHLESVKITNTTYTGISMRDGDAFSKQFGSVNGADGNPDGTNGEDFLILYIYPLNLQSDTLDTIEVVLADYRFSDNSQDFIVDEWMNVDLSTVTEEVHALDFGFASSDMGQWGINTPTYFAMDDLQFTPLGTAGISETENTISLYPNPVKDELNIKGFSGQLRILDLQGREVFSAEHKEFSNLKLDNLSSGTYQLIISDGLSFSKALFQKL